MHYRVILADAIAAHERALEVTPGRQGIHDLGRIEAAVARPYDGYHRLIHTKAAALIHGVARNHGFIDGNKRTALLLCLLLLEKSGFELIQSSTVHDENDLEHLIIDVTTRFLTEEEAKGWLKRQIHRKQ